MKYIFFLILFSLATIARAAECQRENLDLGSIHPYIFYELDGSRDAIAKSIDSIFKYSPRELKDRLIDDIIEGKGLTGAFRSEFITQVPFNDSNDLPVIMMALGLEFFEGGGRDHYLDPISKGHINFPSSREQPFKFGLRDISGMKMVLSGGGYWEVQPRRLN